MRPIAVVEEHRATESWNVVIAGWCFCVFLAKKSAEHCARDINQDHADGIKEAVAEAVKKDRTCRECGGTDSVCLKGHEDSMKEVRERERKAVAERDARIAELSKLLERIERDIEKELDEAYSAGVKEGTRAERGRCATIADTRTDGDWQGRAIAEAIRSGQEPGGER